MADAFPKPTARKDGPPANRRKPNPAEPAVKAALDQGWQTIPVTPDNVANFRGQLNRAGVDLGLKVKTRYPKGTPDVLWFIVERKADKPTA